MALVPIDLMAHFANLGFLADRSPGGTRQTVGDDALPWAETLATYRDGAIFVVHYAGDSEWERHPADEVVMVVDGDTTMTLITEDGRQVVSMGAMQLLVVPANTWHRFETPEGVRVMTVTPQPTEHQVADPSGPH